MKSSFLRRIEAIERRLSTAAGPQISALEVADVKAAFHRKLGLRWQREQFAAPLSLKAVEKAGGSALQKLRSFLDSRGA